MTEGRLPAGLDALYRVAAAELGFATAADLVAGTLAAEGPDALEACRRALGRTWPVLDAMCEWLLAGRPRPTPRPEAVVAALGRPDRLVVVGLETLWMDALLRELPGVEIHLLCESGLDPDWPRVLANWDGRVKPVRFGDFLVHSGRRSALLVTLYASEGGRAYAPPEWIRVAGADVRMCFPVRVGWDILPQPFYVYPRWLSEVDASALTAVVVDEAGA